ncbi:histidine kinase [Tabrizicola sp. WMC-M-20]|nr:histidine kinase [Tabrizicola sp. WMC-M-20]
MNGKIAAGAIVISAALAGVAIWYLQIYAFYEPVSFTPGQEILLTTIDSGQPEPILAEGVTGIDADSSPLRFRACFTTPLSHAMLSETYVAYEGAVPLIAPGWFDCFDAMEIGTALERGEALAFLSQSNIAADIDRVVAVFPDGRAFAWHQLNPAAED